MAELKYWLWFSEIRGIPRQDLLAVLEHFGSPEEVYFAGEAEYRNILSQGWEPLLNKSMGEVRGILRCCEENGFSVLTMQDSQYPSRLKNIYDPPFVLYVKGKLPDLNNEAAVAVVGTRSCTPYGVVTAEKLSYEMARCGGTVVTGLARGIDTAAAKGALRAGGKVIGVLGCGLDIVYPRSNESLFEDVAATGAIITEFKPGTPPEGRNFPIRNRILSGISLGVTLIEAPERSGALITAGLALEQGRDVFVAPGNIDAPSCRGSNGLLKEGAYPVFSGWDIMSQYAAAFPDKIRDPDGVKLRALDNDARDALVEGEMAEAGKRAAKKPAPEKAPKPENREKTTKKGIDNDKEPGYIEIPVDPESLTLDERSVLEAFHGKTHVDDLISGSGLPAQAVMSALTMLEIQGLITQEPGKYFTPHFKLT